MVLQHYQEHGRKNLPWKKTRDPYKILVSEIMLQQTQVSRVLPKYRQFLRTFPSLKTLATAPDAKLLQVWQGLGYWRRAKYLKSAAQAIVKKHSGKFPHDIQILESLPGLGLYTARAVACFAFGSREPFIDTNIRRVYLHFFFKNQKNVSDKDILKIAQRALPTKDPRLWHYALFDFGATVLKDKKINRASRHYTKQSKFTGSFRSYRALALKILLQQPRYTLSRLKLKQKIGQRADDVLAALIKDKLVKIRANVYSLR